MLKIISKINCPRCEEIKKYLEGRGIEFVVEMAEDLGYEVWRGLILEKTGKAGFPLLMKKDRVGEYLNGSTEEIIEKLNEWYPISTGAICNSNPEDPEMWKAMAEECTHPLFSWAFCVKCGWRPEEKVVD